MARKKKEEKEQLPIVPSVQENTLEDIMADRFARYSKYIIQERALPDARDGLKPVQRRILYAMHEAGNTYNKPYHKSAKTVGNVIGNYHPHGDSSVYDAMVRLSQPWKINLPLIDMQGNNGSIDDDPAAAMRYTECRLAHISDYLMEDIDKDTVEWAPNFSDEKMEPTVLPARYPNLLTHGISGIAAGYATNIPPHNLNEVIAACIYRIKHPDCSLKALMKYVKGPDFPTGGIVMSLSGIEQAFTTGKGKIIIRSKVSIEKTKTIDQIVIHEIPYEVVKSQLVKRIDDLRMAGKLPGVLEVRDESDRNGMRIVLDVKKDAPVDALLNYLYKHSDLQISYTYNMIAIVNKTPTLLGLAAALDAFIAHRKNVVIKRSTYLLKNASDRLHILDGLIKALSILDEIIAVIRASENKADAKNNLCERFEFSQAQAEAIVSMRLYRLTHTDIVELQQEAANLEAQIEFLHGVLSDENKLFEVIIDELKELQNEFKTPRRTQIEEEVQEVIIDEKAMIPDETFMLSVSKDGYVKRVSLRSYTKSAELVAAHKEQDEIIAQGAGNSRATLLFFTNRGKYGYLPVYSIEEVRWKDLGSHISSYVKLSDQEKIVSAFLLSDFYNNVQIITATKRGSIKRSMLSEFSSSRTSRTMTAMKVGEQDEIIGAIASFDENDELYLATADGFGLHYPVSQIPQSSLKSKGVRAMNVSAEDDLIGILDDLHASGILLYRADGQMKRVHPDDFASANRPAKGGRLFKQLKTKPVTLSGLVPADAGDEILFDGAEPLSLKAASVPFMASTQGFSKVSEQPLQFVPSLMSLHEGNWKEKEEEFVQPSLFEGEAA
jgi:topoisomerase-4 subunit A